MLLFSVGAGRKGVCFHRKASRFAGGGRFSLSWTYRKDHVAAPCVSNIADVSRRFILTITSFFAAELCPNAAKCFFRLKSSGHQSSGCSSINRERYGVGPEQAHRVAGCWASKSESKHSLTQFSPPACPELYRISVEQKRFGYPSSHKHPQ